MSYPTFQCAGLTFVGFEDDGLDSREPHFAISEGFVPRHLHSKEEIESLGYFVHNEASSDRFWLVMIGERSEIDRFFQACEDAL